MASVISDGSMISQTKEGGRQSDEWGTNLLFRKIFAENCKLVPAMVIGDNESIPVLYKNIRFVLLTKTSNKIYYNFVVSSQKLKKRNISMLEFGEF